MREDFLKLWSLRIGGGAARRRPRRSFRKPRNTGPKPRPARPQLHHHPWCLDRETVHYTALLRQILRNEVGRPWTQILAELCWSIDRDGMLLCDIAARIRDAVRIDGVRILHGKPFHSRRLAAFRPIGHRELYVDPRDGVLKEGQGARG